MAKIILFEVAPLIDGVPLTIRMASKFADAADIYLDGKGWLPLITNAPGTDFSIGSNGTLGDVTVSYGSLSFSLGKVYQNDGWNAYEWSGAQFTLLEGDIGAAIGAYKVIGTGSVSGITREGNTATVELLGPDAELTANLLVKEYAGTGGLEGDSGLKGKLRPMAFGNCQSVDAVLIDGARWIYQAHGYGACVITQVYEFAQALDNSLRLADQPDYAALAALSMSPGQWATCPSQGLFRLGGAPTKKVSADVTAGSTKLGPILKSILVAGGLLAGQIGDFGIFGGLNFCQYITEQTAIGDLARNCAKQGGGYLFADENGVWQIGDYFALKSPAELYADGSTAPKVLSVKELTVVGPAYRVRIGYNPCWSVHGDGDVSPAVGDVADDLAALQEEVQEAREAADQAALDAITAKSRLSAMDDDGILDRSEKLTLIQQIQVETNAYNKLTSEAQSYTVDASGLTAGWTDLMAYINGLTPSVTDKTQDTPVDRATFDGKWEAYFAAKVGLAQAISAKISALAAAAQGTANTAADTAAAAAATAQQVASDYANFVGVDLYPVFDRLDGVAELGVRALTANDAAARGYRDEALGYVNELRSDVLADGTNWQTAIDNLTTKFNTQQTTINDNKTVSSNADKANADAITVVGAKADQNAASLLDEKQATSTKFDAMATRLEEIQAGVDSNTAGISTEQKARADAISAETSDRRQQISSLNDSLSASINTESTTRATQVSSQSSRIDQLNANLGNAVARITNAETNIANGDNANASAIRTVQANLDGTNNTLSIVQQSANASSNRLGNVEANYALTVQAGNTIVGFKAIASSSGTSQLVFQAEAIAFRNPGNGGAEQLMEYRNGKMSVRSAAIGDATIGTAHIQSLSVGTNNLAINSVTVPHYAERNSVMYGVNYHQEALSYSYHSDYEHDLTVTLFASQGFPGGDKIWECILYVDGVQLHGGGGAKTADTFALGGRIHLGAGDHRIYATWRGENGNVRLNAMRFVGQEYRR